LLYRAGAGHLVKSDEEAYRIAKPAADANHPDAAFLCAQLRLVHWYTAGLEHRDVFDEALYYFTVAAESEHHDAQFMLGYILLCQACGIDDELYRLAASMQHDVADYDDHIGTRGGSDSYFSGGSMSRYARDHSNRYNDGGSIGYLGHHNSFEPVAAFSGFDLHNQMNLAEMFVVDLGAVEKSKYWFARATDGGNVQAMRMLAQLYLHGCGVDQSDLEAIDWFRLAADHNDVASLCKQAWLTIKGTAYHRDFDEAERLFEEALMIDERCLEARLACDCFPVVRECAKRARGNYTEFLQELLGSAPDLHKFALSVASASKVARIDPENERPKYEVKIREQESERNRLSALASELREKTEHLDAHRKQGQPRLPRHILLISRRLPALQLLLDSVKNCVATIECDEADDTEDIIGQVKTTVADAVHTWSATSGRTELEERNDFRLDSIALIHKGGELNELVPRLRSACGALPVEHFDEDTWGRQRALLADRAGEYFDTEQQMLWHQAAEKYALLEEEKIVKAAGRVTRAQEDARTAEMKLQEDEDERQRVLRDLHDRRKRRQEEHGVSRFWGEQHDPALADFLDDENPDSGAEPSLFGQPLLSCSRRMSLQEGLDRLPRAIEACAEYVRNQIATIDTDILADLFKMPHNLDVVKKLTEKLDCVDLANLDLERRSLHVLDVAWVIVTWLTELPQPLLSTPLPGKDDEEMFQRIQQVGLHAHDISSDESSDARAISDLKQLLEQVPADHYSILAFVMQLLHEAETEYAKRVADDGKIDAKRASLTLTPALVRQAGSAKEATRLNHRVVAVMIEHFDLVFWEQKLYPGTYRIEGHVSSVGARGTLVLTDSHKVEGYLAVCPCIEQRETPHPASWMVRHILDGGTWGMDGKISFAAR
jgi:TPR repeat protein